MIYLAMDTIDEIEVLMIIFSMIARLISRLSCSELGKINDHKYMLI